MNRRDFLKHLAAGAAAFCVSGCECFNGASCNNPGPAKPNIIFIMTDDQGPWAFASAPDPNAYTPNIDGLRRQGTRLTNYFVTTPVCSPSRASLMTGRYSTEVNIPDYLSGSHPGRGLDRKFPTWPRILDKAGYATALIGKWHLGKKDEFYPTHYGYDEFTGFRVGGFISKDPKIEINRRVRRIEGYTPDILTNYAIDFVRQNKKGPFMLSLHFWAPHANTANRTPDGDRTWLPLSDADWNRFKNSDPELPHPDYPKLDIPRAKRMMREYFGSVASADRNIGRLLDTLEKLNISENTIVIFTSDNGYNLAHNGIWHKGNGRWLLVDNQGPRPNMYDNSLKVPAIIRWPGVVKAGGTVSETVTNLDWFPTILSMAGLNTNVQPATRGKNFLPLLKGREIPWENDLFAQYSMWDWHQTGAELRAWRTPEYKLVRDFRHSGKDELYDLVNDPAEKRNIIDSTDPEIQDVRKRLNRKLLERMRSFNDPALKLVAETQKKEPEN